MHQTKTNKIQLQKEKDTGKILVKRNAGIKSKISIQEIILKQKEQEEKARENELNGVKKEIEIKSKENINSTSKF